MGELVALDTPRLQRLQEVVGAVAVAGDAEVDLVPPGVAGRDQQIVATGVVPRELEHRPPAVGAERIAGGGEEPAQRHQRVHRAHGLGEIGRVEGEEVGDLLALDVHDAQRLPRAQRHRARGAGGYVDATVPG